MFRFVVLSTLVAACVAFDCESSVQLNAVGCFQRNTEVFNQMLSNNRDESSDYYIGSTIDWNAFENSLKTLACHCADKAKEDGYIAIALGFYGECYATKDRVAFESLKKQDSARSKTCVNTGYENCGNTTTGQCVGVAHSEYIYEFPSQAPEVIDGGFSEWSEYTECSATCGDGIQVRERACNNPSAQNGGKGCEELGETTETTHCKITECPVNGKYGEWSSYGSCSKTCGGGSKKRSRNCDSPAPAFGGDDCVGSSEESTSCNTQNCPVNGEYGQWSSYGSCSKTCGGGSKKRSRSCDSPAPAYEGNDCVGPAEESTSCNTQNCPVDGNYGSWSSYGACSKSCGSGTKTKTRSCNNPAPAYNGKQCSGDSSHSVQCNTQPCLGSSSCYYKYTAYNDDGDGDSVYLDRHTLSCPNGEVMEEIKLQRNSAHTKIRYRFRCCKSRLVCQDDPTIYNTYTYNGGDGENYYLDRQTVQCSDGKGISYLKLDRTGDNWRYKYMCCNIEYSGKETTCYNKYTSYNDDGDGESVYLDRHDINCGTNEFITKLKLERNSSHNKIRYSYRCCYIKTPSVTN